jgi:8-oxo-dGTP diphosphatase
MRSERVFAGVGAVIRDGDRVLMMERQGAHAAGTWSLPGGAMEVGEHWFDTARREVWEETRLAVFPEALLTVTNDVFPDDRQHWVTLFVACKYLGGEPVIVEPEKCSAMRWMTAAELDTVPLMPGTGQARHSFFPEF